MHDAPAVRKATTVDVPAMAGALTVVDELTLPTGPSVGTMWRTFPARGSRA